MGHDDAFSGDDVYGDTGCEAVRHYALWDVDTGATILYSALIALFLGLASKSLPLTCLSVHPCCILE